MAKGTGTCPLTTDNNGRAMPCRGSSCVFWFAHGENLGECFINMQMANLTPIRNALQDIASALQALICVKEGDDLNEGELPVSE